MGKLVIDVNRKQLEAIYKDFEDANIAVETSWENFHKGKTVFTIYYNDEDDSLVAGIVKYRMKNNENEKKS